MLMTGFRFSLQPCLAALSASIIIFSTPSHALSPEILRSLGGVLAPMSQQQEVIVGSRLDKTVRERYPASTNEGLQYYVSQVGKKIAVQTYKNYPFTFTVLEDPRTANAFASPGGFIYVTTGLLNILENESQLAAVLAHESAHVMRRHVTRQMQQQSATDLALLTLSKITSKELDPRLTKVGQYLLLQKFSRDDESEADLIGIQLMVRSGYNPQGMVQLLNKLNALESRGLVLPFLQSHPTSQARIEVVREIIARNKLEQPGQILDTQEFHQYVR